MMEVVLKAMSHDMRAKNSNTVSCMLNSPLYPSLQAKSVSHQAKDPLCHSRSQ